MRAVIWGVIGMLACVGVAHAWDFGPNDPGPRFPTTIRPWGNGGAVIQQPGQFPTYVRPWGNGGSVIQRPGQFPTYCRPMGNSIVCN